MQTQVIEKNNKQRCCEHVKRAVQVSLFFRRAIKEVDFFFKVPLLLDGNNKTSFVARQFPQFDLRLVFTFKSQVMSSCLLHIYNVRTHTYMCCVYAFIHIWVCDLPTDTHTTYTQRTLAMLSITFFSLSNPGLLLVGAHPRETFMCVLIELSVSTLCDGK